MQIIDDEQIKGLHGEEGQQCNSDLLAGIETFFYIALGVISRYESFCLNIV